MSKVTYGEVPIGDLRKNPWNTNHTSVENNAKIRRSIERNGVFKPIIVREVFGVPGYEIVGGEHRWEQAAALGHLTIPIANLGEIDDKRAKEIGVIDNSRYGADDTLSFAELLKEIGDPDELKDFLPLGQSDLDALFSAQSIMLEDLDLEDNFDAADVEEMDITPTPKPTKTHVVSRFKLSLADAERVTKLIAETQKTHGLTAEDDLTNAGDALIQLLGPLLSKEATK